MKSLLKFSGLASLLFLANLSAAWGPASHYWYSCQGVHNSEMGNLCVQGHPDLMSGSELPDAFIFGPFTTGLAPGTSPCNGLGALHSPFFGGVLVKQAIMEASNTSAPTCYTSTGEYKHSFSSSNCFNAYDFAMGFGSHVIADLAGFLFKDAYLGSGYRVPFDGGAMNPTTNWISVWPFMTSVDSYVVQNRFGPEFACPAKVLELDDNATSFIARANTQLVKEFPTFGFPTVDVKQVAACAASWHEVISNECYKSTQIPKSTYQWEMQYNDMFGATNFSDTESHFMMAEGCAIEGVELWRSAIEASNSTALSAAYAALGAFYQWFGEAKCTPMPETAPPTSMQQQQSGKLARGSVAAEVEEAANVGRKMERIVKKLDAARPGIDNNAYLKAMGWRK